MPAPSRRIRTRRSRYVRARIAVFFFWAILIFSQLCPPSSAELDGTGRSGSWSAPRKGRFFDTVNSFRAAKSPSRFVVSNGNDSDGLPYEEDERLVHTGPNPLHN